MRKFRPAVVGVAFAIGALLVVPAIASAERSTVFPVGSAPGGAWDENPITVGTAVRPDVDGELTAIRFFKVPGDAGVHTGAVWTTDGTLLGSVAFTGESASGWQEAALPAAIAVSAGTTYVVGVHSSDGSYGATNYLLVDGYRIDSAIAAVPSVPAPAPLLGNGLYTEGPSLAFPTSTFRSSSYFVDVVLEHDPVVAPTRPGVQGDGPVLVATDPSERSSEYLTDILLAEGIPQHAWTDAANVATSVAIDSYETIIWPSIAPTGAQVTALTAWVEAGGTLIAMRPDAALDPLLGTSRTPGSISNGYLDIDTTQQPGTGLASVTIQFHGSAALLDPLAGTRSVATLYSDRDTATAHAAVTTRSVGLGVATAFAYDLPSSIIATRQGNIAWEGQNRDGKNGPQRSGDFFVGDNSAWALPAVLDPANDWVDFQRIQIPQADEQQRLLAKLVSAAPGAMPVPRLWYLPRQLRAVLVLTGDGHASVFVNDRIERLDDMSPTGCSVPDWECRRQSFYLWNSHLEDGVARLSDAAVDAATDRGYEFGLHHDTNCLDRTAAEFESDPVWGLDPQLATWTANYPSQAPQQTIRTHCVHQAGWVDTQKIGREAGIRMNVDSYLWPAEWVQDRPALMTGSALPMRLADRDGSRIDVWAANTQITDESGQSLAATTRTLLDNALDPDTQAFGAYVANMHLGPGEESRAQTVLNVAVGRGVPVISAAQLLEWSDARAATTLEDTTWDGTALGFDVETAARNLDVLVPAEIDGKRIASVERCDGAILDPDIAVIKGVEQAFIRVTTGRYAVSYGATIYDEQFACTGVPTPPPTGGGTGGDGGGGSTTTTTTTTTTDGGTTGGVTGGGSTVEDGIPTRLIRTSLTNRWMPRLATAPCGAVLGKPCILETSAAGLRSTVKPITSTPRATTRPATLLFDKRLAEDGRWRQVAVATAPVTADGVTFTWRPARMGAGIYRMRVAFPAEGDIPAGISVPSFVRVVAPRLRSIVTATYLPGGRNAGCGTRITRPCPLGTDDAGLRTRVQALPSVTRPSRQRASFSVERRTLDGRWTRVTRRAAPIRRGVATFDWRPAAGTPVALYRIRAAFPAAGRVPAGTSRPLYVLLGER